MKIAIISDVHNNEVNLKKVLDYCKRDDIKIIICCGDLASDETLEYLSENFSGTVHYTFGNMDNDQLRNFEFTKKYKKILLYSNYGEAEIDNKKVAFAHFPDIAQGLCKKEKYDFVFYGHTHKPWVSYTKASSYAKASEDKSADQGKKCTMLNPGNVAGEIYPPTFAVWDTKNDNFTLIRVHSLR